jgi:hypothetical protein
MSGRIRTIKPEVLDDERAVSLSDGAWRMWISLRCVADDFGNGRFGHRYLGATIWQDTSRDVSKERAELVAAGKVIAYVVDDQHYFHLVGWEREQRIDNRGKPRVPGPEDVPTSDRVLTPHLAANLREPPQVAEPLRDSPRFAALPPTSDHRSPTPTSDPADVAEPPPPAAPSALGGPVGVIWAHYVGGLKRIRPRRKPILDGKDRKTIGKQLAAGFTVEDLCKAVDGLLASPHHLGSNDTATDYLELRYAIKEPTRMIAIADNATPPPRSLAVVRALPSPDVERVDPAEVEAGMAIAFASNRGAS